VAVTLSLGTTGPTGPTGAQGPTGPTGPQGDTPTEYVQTFNGATGVVIGVSSVNGMTGGVTAGYIHIGTTAPASPTEMDFWFETDTGSFYAYIDEGGGAAWVEISSDPAVAVTSVNGQTGDVIVSGGGGGSTYYAGDGLTLDGVTFAIDSTAVIHVAGISSDGGITAGGEILATEDIKIADAGSAVVGRINQNGSSMQFRPNVGLVVSMDGNGIYTFGRNYSSTYTEAGSYLKAGTYVHVGTGISMDAGGITFPDGTYQDTAATSITDYVESFNGATGAVQGVSSVNGATGNVTVASEFISSHTALLEYPDNKSYSLDAYTVANRTYNFFYGIVATGGCSADLFADGITLSSINVTPSGVSASFSTVVGSGSEIKAVISGVSTGIFTEDLRIVAGYTQ